MNTCSRSMSRKQDILFVIPGLDAGGGEKALVNLLHTLDPDLYNIDLLLFNASGLFMNQVPAHVNIIAPGGDYRLFTQPIVPSVTALVRRGKWKLLWSRMLYARTLKRAPNAAEGEQEGWQYWSQSMEQLPAQYDVAVAFLEKSSVYFVADKVKARKKIAWIHTVYSASGLKADFDLPYFKQLDTLVGVSARCVEDLVAVFPDISTRVTEIPNITSGQLVRAMGAENLPVPLRKSSLDIVTVARLSEEKGMVLLVETVRVLKKREKDFVWYVIGEGPQRGWMEQQIEEHGLAGHLVLLGLQQNPYTFIRWADIYCQTSRYEGKSIAIDEAKLLGRPIVTTNFETVHDQLQQEYNAVIAAMQPEAMADALIRVSEDDTLRACLVRNLSDFSLNETDIIDKIATLFT